MITVGDLKQSLTELANQANILNNHAIFINPKQPTHLWLDFYKDFKKALTTLNKIFPKNLITT